jgi:hypothetical protein
MFVQSSASRTPKGRTGFPQRLKRWAIVIQSASRTKKFAFAAKPPPKSLDASVIGHTKIIAWSTVF